MDAENSFYFEEIFPAQCDQVLQIQNRQLLVKNRQICRHSNKVIFHTPKCLHQSQFMNSKYLYQIQF